MSRFKIVITDHIFPTREIEQRLLGEGLGAELVFCENPSEDEMAAIVRDADAVLVTFYKLTEKIVESMQRCRIIARYGVGYDNVPVALAAKKGIAVTNVPDYCVDEVSDHALTLLLALARKVVQLNQQVKSGGWDFRKFTPIFRLRGSTLGLIAYGRIGRELGRKARALGMNVLVHDPYIKSLPAEEGRLVDLPTLLKGSDFISIHCPLTAQTRNLINRETLSLMKPTAFIANTARGGIIDEEALAEALGDGTIAGAALDVVAKEPLAQGHPLLQAPNCILTPHVAFHSEDATVELQEKASTQVIKALTGQPLDYRVN